MDVGMKKPNRVQSIYTITYSARFSAFSTFALPLYCTLFQNFTTDKLETSKTIGILNDS